MIVAPVLVACAVAWSTGVASGPAQPSVPAALPSAARYFAFRVRPGQDLRKELYAFVRREGLRAGVVVTCVGSLTDVSLRFANQRDTTVRKGHFEIVSLVGTLDPAGGHLHLCVADRDGVTFGGHLVDGCLVYTTAEIVVADLTALEFRREPDRTFGYDELTVYPRAGGR
jgi:predicted DNA-binding protein with PD1-like motif